MYNLTTDEVLQVTDFLREIGCLLQNWGEDTPMVLNRGKRAIELAIKMEEGILNGNR